VAPSFGIMADFIKPIAYGTNVASFRNIVNDAYTYTFTLANSSTDIYSTSSPPSSCSPSRVPTISFNSGFIFDLDTRPW
jgi:hypothetical protein